MQSRSIGYYPKVLPFDSHHLVVVAGNNVCVLKDGEKLFHYTHSVPIVCSCVGLGIPFLALVGSDKSLSILKHDDSSTHFFTLHVKATLAKLTRAMRFGPIESEDDDPVLYVGYLNGGIVSIRIPVCETGTGSPPELVSCCGHISSILALAIDPTESFLLTGIRDEKIRVSRYPRTFLIESFLLGHRNAVTSLAFVEVNGFVEGAAGESQRHVLVSGDILGSVLSWDYLASDPETALLSPLERELEDDTALTEPMLDLPILRILRTSLPPTSLGSLLVIREKCPVLESIGFESTSRRLERGPTLRLHSDILDLTCLPMCPGPLCASSSAAQHSHMIVTCSTPPNFVLVRVEADGELAVEHESFFGELVLPFVFHEAERVLLSCWKKDDRSKNRPERRQLGESGGGKKRRRRKKTKKTVEDDGQ